MIKQSVYSSMSKAQRINHFPRSYEITRKNLFYQRISRMQALYGDRAYDFVPKTYLYPQEMDVIKKDILAKRGGKDQQCWIFKPCASSQGKGIFVTNNLDEVPLKHNFVASEYISRPLLINGLKFDLRLYVAITSVNPLRIYLYDEGLARFATEKYESNGGDLKNVFAHLTNYSINKKNLTKFVQPPQLPGGKEELNNESASKWSLAMLRAYVIKNKVGGISC